MAESRRNKISSIQLALLAQLELFFSRDTFIFTRILVILAIKICNVIDVFFIFDETNRSFSSVP